MKASESSHWQNEKSQIQKIRHDQRETANKSRREAQEAERKVDLERAAELRYGRIIQLEKEQEEAAETGRQSKRKERLLSEEIDGE